MSAPSRAISKPVAGTLKGVLPVLQLPYHDDETIDFDTLCGEIDWLLKQGAHGVTMAIVTETLRLTTDERRQVATAICRRMDGHGHAVISVGARSTFVAVEQARDALFVWNRGTQGCER